jgi:hypothetical protein
MKNLKKIGLIMKFTPHCSKRRNEGWKTLKKKKPWKRKKKDERENQKLTQSSHVNHTFFTLDPWIGPQAFRSNSLCLTKKYYF